MTYLDTRLGSLPRTGSFVQSLGSFNTLAELNATHPANNYNPGTTAYTVDQGFMISDGAVWESPGMVPGEEDVTAATYAAARLLSGAATGARLQVRGRTSQSDGGQGLFTWVAGGSTTINDGSQLSAPGGIWQRPDVTINAQWYGIDPTGVTASDVALNLAIQDAIIQKKKLSAPSGFFLLNAPLLLYPTDGSFASFILEGQGGAPQGGPLTTIGGVQFPNGPAYPNTTFYANFNNRPALIVNCTRGSVIRNLCVIGQNMPTNVTPYPPAKDPTTYVTGGCRDSRYSPYAGICIDPLTCATPPDGGYPGLTYPVHLNGGSHDLLIENCWIGNFVVGVMGGPGTVNANGDVVTCRNNTVDACRVCYAAGNSQARQWVITGGNVQHSHTAFDTLTYGNQIAPNPQVRDVQIGAIYAVINLTGATDFASITGCYAESVVCIGRYGTPSSIVPPLLIENFHIQALNINAYPVATGPYCPPAMLIAGGPVVFTGCQFNWTTNTVEAWNFVSNNQTANITFIGSHFTGSIEAHRIPPIGIMRNASCATLINCFVNGSGIGGQSQVVSDNLYRGQGSLSTTWGNSIGRLNATCQTARVADTNAEYDYVPPGAGSFNSSNITVSGNTATTLNATTVTFTKTNASQFYCENDILFWSMLPLLGGAIGSVPALKIPVGGIVGNNVTANMLWDPTYYDTVANQSGAGANIDIFVNHWAPTGSLTCTTNGTTALTAVSPVNTLLPGDWVIGSGPNSADIPNVVSGACRVVSNDGAGNAVLSKTATGSHAGVGLRFGYLSPVTPVTKTVATLPPGIPGLRYMVSDALTPAFGAAVAAGGAVTVPVFADNTGAWIVG